MSGQTRRSMLHDELNQAWDQIKINLRKGSIPEVYLQFGLLEQFPQLMEPGGLRLEHMNWNMTPGLYKQTLGLPTLTVKLQIWDKWCKEPYMLWEPTQLAGDFRPGIALVICYSRLLTTYFSYLPNGKDKDAPRSQMAISMTLTYVPEHWPLASFEENSHIINAVWAEGDLVGMISLTRLHKKAPYLPDVSYREYSQHMTIAPLNLLDPLAPLDDAGLLMCDPPHDFAVGALHCKHSSSGRPVG